MGGGRGRGLDFGATYGSGQLPLEFAITLKNEITNVADKKLPKTITQTAVQIGRSLGAAALNYDVKDPRNGKSYKFLEGSTISNVEVFAGKGVRNKLKPAVAQGLSKQIGGKPKDWKHVKGIGTLDVNGQARNAEIHWFEASGQPKVKFKIKRWCNEG